MEILLVGFASVLSRLDSSALLKFWTFLNSNKSIVVEQLAGWLAFGQNLRSLIAVTQV